MTAREQLAPLIRKYGMRKLAVEVEIDPSQLSRWISGQRTLTVEQVELMTETLGYFLRVQRIRVNKRRR